MSCSVCLSICLPPAAAFHPYCPQGFGNNFRRKYTQSRTICQSVVVKVASHVCKFGLFAPVIPLFHCHVCRSWVFAPVVGFTCANPALLPPSFFTLNFTCANRGFLPPLALMMLSRTASRARSAQGASQAEFLREGIFRCRAGVGRQGKLFGDGKPAGPDVPP